MALSSYLKPTCQTSRKDSDSGLFVSDNGLDEQWFTGKENRENILQSIDEGSFKMEKFRETLTDDAQGPEQDRVFKDLTPEEKDRYKADDNKVVLDEEQLLFISDGQDNTFDDDVDEAPVQDLALNNNQVFQADQCDAFDSDVDEAPTA
nr:retrovirus-related Pol polyprotein from transposon TNT 1-94 [Tanacetum cinerariifolium]